MIVIFQNNNNNISNNNNNNNNNSNNSNNNIIITSLEVISPAYFSIRSPKGIIKIINSYNINN